MKLFFRLIGEKSFPVKILIFFLIAALSVANAFLDYYIKNVNFFIFYSFYIIIVSLVLGTKEGFLLAVINSVANYFVNRHYLENGGDIFFILNMFLDLSFYVLIVIIVSELRKSLLREIGLSRTDSLTGAANKRFFSEILEIEINKFKRNKKSFCLVYIDMDNFKNVNDSYGHSKGDEVLRIFVDILKNNLRAGDIVGRLGGDEFIIILPESDKIAATLTLERMNLLFNTEMKSQNLPVTLSIGISVFKSVPQSVDEAYQKADSVMYDAKNSGKNKIEVKEF
jgi:diguanylate cyclase (GGDEF)-like protein